MFWFANFLRIETCLLYPLIVARIAVLIYGAGN